MYPVSDRFLTALRSSHTMVSRVDAWSGNVLLKRDVPISDGSVSVSSGTGVHRKLTVTIADQSLWELLSPVGVELKAYRGVRYPGGEEELVPLGVFSLDAQSVPVLTGGGISISGAPDRWAFLQRARFENPRVSNYPLTNVEQIAVLVREVLPGVGIDTGGVTTQNILSGTQVAVAVWDRDRDKTIEDLCTAAGVEAFFGNHGQFVIRDLPVLGGPPVWRVHAGRDGVMISGTASRDRSRVYNVVVVVSSKTDGSAPFAPVVVEDTDRRSPTNVHSNYLRAPYFLITSTISNAEEARAAGAALLAKTTARYVDMSVTAVVNPALEAGDLVTATDETGNSRLYQLDSFAVPLTTEASQPLTFRSLAAVSEDTSSGVTAASSVPTDSA